MHLSLIFSTLVSFVVLAAAYPTNSLGKREELDSNLFGHLTDGRKLPDKRSLTTREELDSNLVGYAGYFDEPDKREELDSNLVLYSGTTYFDEPDKREELDSDIVLYSGTTYSTTN